MPEAALRYEAGEARTPAWTLGSLQSIGGLAGLAGLLLLSWALSLALSLPTPIIAIAVFTGAAFARTTSWGLVLYFVFFTATLTQNPELEPEEIIFLIYHIVYLGGWFALRIFVYRERLVRSVPDAAAAAFLVLLAFSTIPTLMFGGDILTAANEGLNLSLVALYFPIKEACARSRPGADASVAIVLLLSVGALLLNMYILREVFTNAEMAWQYARSRVAMNEILLVAGAVLSLGLSTALRGKKRLVGFAVFAALAGGVILTQSRAYYVDLVAGIGLVLVAAPRDKKLSLFLGLAGGFLFVAAVAYALLGDRLILVALGVADRILSIGTAVTSEVSFLNRALETDAVMSRIRLNPFLGYGLGVPFSFYDAVFDGTWTKTYAHNGFLTVWFKMGIGGLLAVIVLWAGAVYQGIVASRVQRGWYSALGMSAAVALACLLPSHFSSAPFSTADTVICFSILAGIASGAYSRVSLEAALPEEATLPEA